MLRLTFITSILIILTSCENNNEENDGFIPPISNSPPPIQAPGSPPPLSSPPSVMIENNGGCPHPLPESWIFCDDFEQGGPNADNYFERHLNQGKFHRTAAQAASGTYSMEVNWETGMVEAGNLKVSFGDAPIGATHRPGEQFNEIFWRMYVKHQENWQGSPAKLSRATMFTGNNWSQGMIAHLWSASDILMGDPATCTTNSTPACTKYNDFENLKWLGQMPGETPIFATSDTGQWRCIEGHVQLNTPGESNGVFEFWIDDNLEKSRSDLNWRGTYTDHGINAVFFENYWNAGAPKPLKRWFDNLAISTERIGCF